MRILIWFCLIILNLSVDASPRGTEPLIRLVDVKQTSTLTKKIIGIAREPFHLNWEYIIPDKNGRFDRMVPTDQMILTFYFNKSTVTINLNDPIPSHSTTMVPSEPEPPTPSVSVSSLPKKAPPPEPTPSPPIITPYKDLDDHWIGDIANQLKMEGRLPNTPYFYPQRKIARGEFCDIYASFYDIQPDNTVLFPFDDVAISHPHRVAIQTMVSSGQIKGVTPRRFEPDAFVTRVQTLVMIARSLPPVSADDLANMTLPFSDIDAYKWAETNIKTTLFHNIIPPDLNLNPNKQVSKAELLLMLYKASKI